MFITTNNLEIFPQSVGTFSHFLQTAATTLRVEQELLPEPGAIGPHLSRPGLRDPPPDTSGQHNGEAR